jgi:comEA protein
MVQRLFRDGVLFAVVCMLTQTMTLATTKKPPIHPININAATAEELQEVPGIGPATAGKILQMRKSYGAFKSVDDLLAIRGIGPKRLGKMRKYLVAGRSPQLVRPSPVTAKPASCAACSKKPLPQRQAAPQPNSTAAPPVVPKSKSTVPDGSTSDPPDEEPESK